ncbi:DNA polymerase [Aneurinibacillus migulanus]|uniref:group II intron reverse transcriptase/maturase n=1 Tax=Aneurinibacillus migulanus TaxID=47500 RepID=UPI0005BB6AAF|nr:group II intron reverse transcriptase/maturase [Aneurinibacillus migulanus]KIV58562.1 DNA polymerase [Aneurinibacillus migulanus]KPD09266.1 DNA polymerase [Aneurinibacillus migulanus]CEH28309.1 Uncharacterized protein BN1090_A2_00727 [Aneurinibacillus migulanus]
MVQKFDYPKTESGLRKIQDELYSKTQQAIENGELPKFKGLLEIISAEATILTAIHNIKGNKGSQTAGSDGENMREHFLERQYPEIISRVQQSLSHYKPLPVKRVFIPKPGKKEKRPLGIPAIIDRIVQECVRIVIEPILEAQFFKHSYGFRPMRDTHMALERVNYLVHRTGYHWIIEGDISKFFDTVNHTILVKKLWNMGIRDRRVLMIIKNMLKAGIMDELKVNSLGTPRGGIISPLLANAYLHILDQWIVREWEHKKLRKPPKHEMNKYRAMKDSTKLKPAYLVRYADDWVLITDSKSNAEKWKKRISRYLETKLKLKLSEEKTLITNVRKKAIQFLGLNLKAVKGKSRTGWVTVTKPNPERLKAKVKEIHKNIRAIKHVSYDTKDYVVHEINKVNSQIRGVIQYYQVATGVNKSLGKFFQMLRYAGYKVLRKYGGFWTPANRTDNILAVHPNYKTWIPAIKSDGVVIGLTSLRFCTWQKAFLKNPKETPFSEEGRQLYARRTGKIPPLARADELLSLKLSELIGKGAKEPLYNFEYLLNRAYAFNRDKGKCRVCKTYVSMTDVQIHHINPKLPLNKVNRVPNLATVHDVCHNIIHSQADYSNLGKQTWKTILKFREQLK